MSDNLTTYSETFIIRANEVDPDGKITLSAICQLFQEVAGNHALLLNFDITDLHKQGTTWVLHRMDIQINKWPEWRETITIETWPAAGDALRAYRNYRVLSEKGDELGVCLSYWMMMNMKTRRPIRMSKEVLETRLAEREHVMEVQSGRIPKPESVHQIRQIVVRKSDLDMNRHVNNAVYIDWILESMDSGSIRSMKGMDIMFLKESVYGDVITSHSELSKGDLTLHMLTNQNDEMVAQARIRY